MKNVGVVVPPKLVRRASHSPCVPLSQQRSLVLVSLDVYLASCLSICLSYSITVKGPKFKKKKNLRAGNILFPTKRIFCSQLCGRKYFSCGLGMGWIPSLLGQCLRTKPVASHQVSTQYSVFFKRMPSDVECVHKRASRTVWVHKNVYMYLWPFQGKENLGVVFHMLYIST